MGAGCKYTCPRSFPQADTWLVGNGFQHGPLPPISAAQAAAQRQTVHRQPDRAQRESASLRQRGRRVRQTPEQTAARLAAQAARQQALRDTESAEQTASRQAADAEHHRTARASEAGEETAARQAADAECQRSARATEDTEQRTARRSRRRASAAHRNAQNPAAAAARHEERMRAQREDRARQRAGAAPAQPNSLALLSATEEVLHMNFFRYAHLQHPVARCFATARHRAACYCLLQ